MKENDTHNEKTIIRNELPTPVLKRNKIEINDNSALNFTDIFIEMTEEHYQQTLQKGRIRKLCGDFLYKGTLTFLFANTGVGKSILAHQIGVVVANQFKLKTAYVDMEVSSQQYLERYAPLDDEGNYIGVPNTPKSFTRFEFNPNVSVEGKKALMEKIKTFIKEYDLVIIDNLTNILNNSQDFESGKSFMEEIRKLKELHKTTVLIVAHVTKGIKELNSDSMAGTKVLSNYADDMIGIAKVKNKPTNEGNYVYAVQVKCRSGIQNFDNSNAAVFQILRDQNTGLNFYHKYNANENELTYDAKSERQLTEKEKRNIEIRALKKHTTYTNLEIGKIYGVGKRTVERVKI